LSKTPTLFLVFTGIPLFNRYCYRKKKREEKATKPSSNVTGQELNLSVMVAAGLRSCERERGRLLGFWVPGEAGHRALPTAGKREGISF